MRAWVNYHNMVFNGISTFMLYIDLRPDRAVKIGNAPM